MRKTLLSLFLGLAGCSAWAQGTVVLQNGNSLYLVSTNAFGQGIGVTAKTANDFYYAVLIANYGGPVPSSNPLNVAWSGAVLTGVNFAVIAGGISGQGGSAGAPVAGWGAPTGPQYTDGTEMYFMIVGWSSNFGTSWATVSADLASGWATLPTTNAFIGTSPIGYGFSGGGHLSSSCSQFVWGFISHAWWPDQRVHPVRSPFPNPPRLRWLGWAGLRCCCSAAPVGCTGTANKRRIVQSRSDNSRVAFKPRLQHQRSDG